MLHQNSKLEIQSVVEDYCQSISCLPLFLCGDSFHLLQCLPNESVDCCMTSPPYWGNRQYSVEGVGMEKSYPQYVERLLTIFQEIKRVLKATGSFWLNIGDTYQDKKLLGIPWRVALGLTDKQGWMLRNDVIWNKVKGGPDNAKDKLGNVHEYLFHFVKQRTQCKEPPKDVAARQLHCDCQPWRWHKLPGNVYQTL